MVSPDLHHSLSLEKMSCSVVGASQRILHGVGELVLDEVRSKSQRLIKNRSCDCSEPVSSHLVFADIQISKRGEHSVVTHGPVSTAGARENQVAMSGKWLQFPQDFHCLPAQWNNV